MSKNVIWVDEKDNILGEISREKAHREGLLHRISVIYLINNKGEILINERAKDEHLDHSSAGHVDVGESYLEAAKRELEEELGVKNIELQEIGTAIAHDEYKASTSNHIFKIYICNAAPSKLQTDEVKSVFWADPKKVYRDMQVNSQKYAGGFKASLKVFLDYIGNEKIIS